MRRSLCTVNVITWMLGCSVLGAGIWLKVVYEGYGDLLPSALSLNVLCIAVGSIIFVVSLFGCCGSWFSNRCMLVTYFALVALVLVLEITTAALLFTFREGISNNFQTQLKFGLLTINATHDEDPAMHSWSVIQRSFKCCGVTRSSDWQAGSQVKGLLPDSCCPVSAGYKDCRMERGRRWFKRGCYPVVSRWLSKKVHLVGAVALSFAFIEMMVLIAAMLLICTVRDKRRSRTYKSYATDSMS